MSDLWAVHVEGPDDVLAAPSKEDAEKRADELNEHLKAVASSKDVMFNAVAIPWPHSAESHAEWVKKWNDPT